VLAAAPPLGDHERLAAARVVGLDAEAGDRPLRTLRQLLVDYDGVAVAERAAQIM
jgi:hypothetical protein